jgi:hypothetical protein
VIYLAGVQLLLCDFAATRHCEQNRTVQNKTNGLLQPRLCGDAAWYNRWGDETSFCPLDKCEVYVAASGNYWSSSPNVSDASNAWNVNFKNGNDNWNNKSNTNLVRCVRESKNHV